MEDDENTEYPIVEVKCSNNYIILDYNFDNNIQEYFQSFLKFHHGAAGPTNDYKVNWKGWYLPSDSNTQFLISQDCTVCDENSNGQIYSTQTAYMMTGTLFGCFWNLKGEHNFDQDYNDYTCYHSSGEVNSVGESIRHELDENSAASDWDGSGVCSFSVRSAVQHIPGNVVHDHCTIDYGGITGNRTQSTVYHLKPSIGTEGTHCICVKPSTTYEINVLSTKYETVINARKNEVKKSALSPSKKISSKDDTSAKVTYLYQKDFDYGTYRIQESGTYIIAEDIEFDFNANADDPTDLDAYWPTADQSDMYPGAGGYYDSYFLGFWAGITIEADDVILDLNEHTLKMSEIFYHMQRWFTTIALQSQYFLPGQGIGFFGADPHFAKNIVIKNGILGLSSHHNIHGHFNEHVVLEDLQCRDFETHGIQFNGFNDIVLRNIEIGPTENYQPFRGEFGHAKSLLPRFQKVADENPDKTIKFYGRDTEYTMQDLVDELQTQWEMAYNYAVKDVSYDEDDETWKKAKKIFLNPSNLPNGAAMYGIFLNTYGASVLTYNLYSSFYSTNAVLDNVKVHGLRHCMTEYSRFSVPSSGVLFMNALHAPFDAEQLTDNFDFDNLRYSGSAITDASLAMQYFSDNWNYLQAQTTGNDIMLAWALGTDVDAMSNVNLGCNNDVMIHSGKGVTGIRLDGVKNVVMNNIYVYDIIESTPFGKMDCGNYDSFQGGKSGIAGGHFRQVKPMQYGFSGNMLQGVTINAAQNITLNNVYMEDLESAYGPTFGIALWPATNVSLQGEITLTNIKAGSLFVDDGTLVYDTSNTNKLPEACALRVKDSYTSGDYTYLADIKMNAEAVSTCVTGSVYCFGDRKLASMLGETYTCQDVVKDRSTTAKAIIPMIVTISIIAMIGMIIYILYQKFSRSKDIQYSLLPKDDISVVYSNYQSIRQ